jgi:hypothetical protein
MTRKEERVNYALSFKGKDMENEELKESIQLAILDGAVWADKTMIEKTYEWLRKGGSGWYLTSDFGDDEIDFVKLAEDYRKAMED